MLYETIGKASIAIAAVFLGLLVLSFILGVVLVKKKKLILPRVLLFTLDTFYLQVKKLAKVFGLNERIIDQIGIEIRNHLNFESFSKVPAKERILVVPQCLRHIKCPARLDSKVGITCKQCGMCIINELKSEAERLGYGFYVVPGGRFVERIVRTVKPRGALGVACTKDLNTAMLGIWRSGVAVQGVPLAYDGCIETKVDLQELFRRMRAGIEDAAQRIEKGCEEKPASRAGA